jgi:hypothetical protein
MAATAASTVAGDVAVLLTLNCSDCEYLLSANDTEHIADALIVLVVLSISIVPPLSANRLRISEPACVVVTPTRCFE